MGHKTTLYDLCITAGEMGQTDTDKCLVGFNGKGKRVVHTRLNDTI